VEYAERRGFFLYLEEGWSMRRGEGSFCTLKRGGVCGEERVLFIS
jgi:hypothetical protein